MNIYYGGKLLNTYETNKYRPIDDSEIKALFEKIKLNTDFSLPDKLIQDFINDGSIEAKFKKCTNFTNADFNHMIIHIKKRKNIKKVPPKPSSKKNKKKAKTQSQSKTKKIRKHKDFKKTKD
jgi:hypothetical protein